MLPNRLDTIAGNKKRIHQGIFLAGIFVICFLLNQQRIRGRNIEEYRKRNLTVLFADFHIDYFPLRDIAHPKRSVFLLISYMLRKLFGYLAL